MCVKIRENPDIQFFVVGHTDSAGSTEYNFDLSKRRADAVKRYLVGSNCGADETQIETRGYGEEVLDERFKPNDAEQRRVEVRAVNS